MSVRVNLLPRATKEGARSSRQRLAAGGLLLVILIGLVFATLLQRGTLSDAEDEREVAQAELAAASAEVAALADYADLERRLDEDRQLIITALGNQVTLAGILQDISLVMPVETDFRSLAINLTAGEVDEEGALITVGSLQASGESLAAIAPGVERLLIQLERVAGFQDVYVSSITIDEDDIASFSVDLQLGREHLTGRYVDGVPEVTP